MTQPVASMLAETEEGPAPGGQKRKAEGPAEGEAEVGARVSSPLSCMGLTNSGRSSPHALGPGLTVLGKLLAERETLLQVQP